MAIDTNIKQPVFTEFKFDYPTDINRINTLLKESHCGDAPLFFNLKKIPNEDSYNLLDMIENFMRKNSINPKIPYPFFIVSNTINDHDFFLTVRNENELPLFFLKKSARTTKKDQNLLAKKDFHLKRLRCIDIEEKVSQLRRKSRGMKVISDLSHEYLFLSRLKDKLKDTENGN